MTEIEAKAEGDRATTLEFAKFFMDINTLSEEEESAQMAERIADVIQRNLGIRKVRILGAGAFGAAGQIPGTREVLKITNDWRELDAAAQIVGMDLPHVIPIFAVGTIADLKVVNPQLEVKGPVGVVVQRMVDRTGLNTDENDGRLNWAVKFIQSTHEIFRDVLVETDPKVAMRKIMDASFDLRRLLEGMGWPFTEIAEGLAELQKFDVFMLDAHSNNVGWDGRERTYRIFDLGLSSTGEGKEPAVLTGRRRRHG